MTKWDSNIENVILIVNDCLVIGKNDSIDGLIDISKKHFSLKKEINVVDYLSCNILEMNEENKFVII